jgi:predicted nucleotidyltransferase
VTPGDPVPSGPVTAQADALLAVLRGTLPSNVLVAACLYGSAVVGGLRPDSDIDVFGVVGRRLDAREKRDLVAGLLPISGRATRPPAWRPVELTLVVHGEVRPWHYPSRFDFQYGEWLREAFVGGDPAPWPDENPDVAVLVSMVRAGAIPLYGSAPRHLLDPVPRRDLVRAMTDEIPALLDDLESDTRNVLLTLARMWTTVATGEMRSKDGAADWALAQLPLAHQPVLELAREAYLGAVDDRHYDVRQVRSHADLVVGEIRRLAG